MKKLLLGIALATMFVSCFGPDVIRGTGREAKGTFDISPGYTSLSVSSGIVIELVDSAGGTGFITADEAVLDYVSIVEENGRVKVSYEPFVTVHSAIKTVVTMPVSDALANLQASSAAKITGPAKVVGPSLSVKCSSAAGIDLGIETGELTLDVSSAARFRGNISVRNLDLEANSAADCTLEGSADYANIEASSAARVEAFGLVCRRADAEASSAANVEISATEELEAEASSGAAVRYKGSPTTIRSNASSGGTVREAR